MADQKVRYLRPCFRLHLQPQSIVCTVSMNKFSVLLKWGIPLYLGEKKKSQVFRYAEKRITDENCFFWKKESIDRCWFCDTRSKYQRYLVQKPSIFIPNACMEKLRNGSDFTTFYPELTFCGRKWNWLQFHLDPPRKFGSSSQKEPFLSFWMAHKKCYKYTGSPGFITLHSLSLL